MSSCEDKTAIKSILYQIILCVMRDLLWKDFGTQLKIIENKNIFEKVSHHADFSSGTYTVRYFFLISHRQLLKMMLISDKMKLI